MIIRIPNIIFALTFPGTILYYVAISQHLLPPINTGFFGLMCTLSLLTVTPLYIFEIFKTGKIQIIDFSFFSFLAMFFVIVIWHGTNSPDKSLMNWHLVSIAQSISVFTLCKRTFSTQQNTSLLISAFWLLSSACILSLTNDGRFALRDVSKDVGIIPSYQTFALCYMITTVFVVSKIQSRYMRYTVHAIALACLYVNSARSEFAGYFFFAAILEFLSYKNKSTPIILAFILLAASFTAITTGAIQPPESRITALVDLQNDNSSNERDRMSREGIEKIYESPLVGAYGQYEEGGYIHNIMSVWQETGLMGALFFILLITIPAFKGSIEAFSGKADNHALAGLALVLTSILLLIAGKYFTYLLVPASLALYSVSRQKPAQ